MVIFVSPTPQHLAGVGRAVEYFFVQAFISELPVEPKAGVANLFDEPILHGLARRAAVQRNAGLVMAFGSVAPRHTLVAIESRASRPETPCQVLDPMVRMRGHSSNRISAQPHKRPSSERGRASDNARNNGAD